MSRPDLDALLNALFPAARELLDKNGAFHPIAASMRQDETISMVAADMGREDPEPPEVIEGLLAALRQSAASGEIRAAGICLDTHATLPDQGIDTDAICARLEHADGDCVEVYLPYKKGLLGRRKYGDVFATSGERRVFA
jgi:hypothetical protein